MGCSPMRAGATGSGAKFALLALETACVAFVVAYASHWLSDVTLAKIRALIVRLLMLAIALAIMFVLAGCQTDSQQLVRETPQSNDRQIAADHLPRTQFDPSSVPQH
jgi:predicted PurR-regulated permease PerM